MGFEALDGSSGRGTSSFGSALGCTGDLLVFDGAESLRADEPALHQIHRLRGLGKRCPHADDQPMPPVDRPSCLLGASEILLLLVTLKYELTDISPLIFRQRRIARDQILVGRHRARQRLDALVGTVADREEHLVRRIERESSPQNSTVIRMAASVLRVSTPISTQKQ